MDYLARMTVKSLREIATRMNIPGRSGKAKTDLVALITDAILSDWDNAISLNAPEYDETLTAVLTVVDSPRIAGQPLTATVRAMHYKRQNGCDKLTAKQSRRLAKKIFRNRNWQLANI